MKSNNKNKLNVGHSLAFEQIGGLKAKFDKLLQAEQSLTIHSESITEIDLTGVQFLQYCMIQAGMKGKELSFSLKIADESKSILLKNGFTHLIQVAFS